MANYIGFIDETGVLQNSPDQRFFGIGLLKCEDTSVLSHELTRLKNKAEGKLKNGSFEFKFNCINNSSYELYYELISLYFKFKSLQFSCLMLDKENPRIKMNEVYKDTWNAYIIFSKYLIEKNVNAGDKICVISDFLGKPKESPVFYESEIKKAPVVYNACMLESHASLFIQLVDVLIGCISFDFKRSKNPDLKANVAKANVVGFLREKLGRSRLSENFALTEPICFRVQEYKTE